MSHQPAGKASALRPKPRLDPFTEQISHKEFEEELERLLSEATVSEDRAKRQLPMVLMERLTVALQKAKTRHGQLRNEIMRTVSTRHAMGSPMGMGLSAGGVGSGDNAHYLGLRSNSDASAIGGGTAASLMGGGGGGGGLAALSRSPSTQSMSNLLTGNPQESYAALSTNGDGALGQQHNNNTINHTLHPILSGSHPSSSAHLPRTLSQTSTASKAGLPHTPSSSSLAPNGSHSRLVGGGATPTSQPLTITRRIDNAFSAKKGPVPLRDDTVAAGAVQLEIGCLGSSSAQAQFPSPNRAKASPSRGRAIHGNGGAMVPAPQYVTAAGISDTLAAAGAAADFGAQLEAIWERLDPLTPVGECLATLGKMLYTKEALLPSNGCLAIAALGGGSPRKDKSPLALLEGDERSLTTMMASGRLLGRDSDDEAAEDPHRVPGAVSMVGYLQRQLEEKQAQIDFLTGKLNKRTEIMSHIRHTLLKELFILKARQLGPHEVPAFTFFNIIDIVENAQELEVATEALRSEFDAASKSHQHFLEALQGEYHAKRLMLTRAHDTEVEALKATIAQSREDTAVEMERLKARHAEAMALMRAERDGFATQCETLKTSIKQLRGKGSAGGIGSNKGAGGGSSRGNSPLHNKDRDGHGKGGRSNEEWGSGSRRASMRLATASVVHSRGQSFVGAPNGDSDAEGDADPSFPGEGGGKGARKKRGSPTTALGSSTSRRMSSSSSFRPALDADVRQGNGFQSGRRGTVVPSQAGKYQPSSAAHHLVGDAVTSRQTQTDGGGALAADHLDHGPFTMPPTPTALDRTLAMPPNTISAAVGPPPRPNSATMGPTDNAARFGRTPVTFRGGTKGHNDDGLDPYTGVVIDPLNIHSDDDEGSGEGGGVLSHQGSLLNLVHSRGHGSSAHPPASISDACALGARNRLSFASLVCLAEDEPGLVDHIMTLGEGGRDGPRLLGVQSLVDGAARQLQVTYAAPSWVAALLRDDARIVAAAMHAPCEYSLAMLDPHAHAKGGGRPSGAAGMATMVSRHMDDGLRVALKGAVDNATRYNVPSMGYLGVLSSVDASSLQCLKGESITAWASCCCKGDRQGRSGGSLPLFVGGAEGRSLSSQQVAVLESIDLTGPASLAPFDDYQFGESTFSSGGAGGLACMSLMTPPRFRGVVDAAPNGLASVAFVLAITDATAGPTAPPGEGGGGDADMGPVRATVSVYEALLQLTSAADRVHVLNCTSGEGLLALTADEDAAADLLLALPRRLASFPLRAVHVTVAVSSLGAVLHSLVYHPHGCVVGPSYALRDLLSTPFAVSVPSVVSALGRRRGLAMPVTCHIGCAANSADSPLMHSATGQWVANVSAAAPQRDVVVRVAKGACHVGPFATTALTIGTGLGGASLPDDVHCAGAYAVTQLAVNVCRPSLGMLGVDIPHRPLLLYLATVISSPLSQVEGLLHEQALQRYVASNQASPARFYFNDCHPLKPASADGDGSVGDNAHMYTHIVASTDPSHLVRLVAGAVADMSKAALRVVVDVRSPHLMDPRNWTCDPMGVGAQQGSMTSLPSRLMVNPSITPRLISLLGDIPPPRDAHLVAVLHADTTSPVEAGEGGPSYTYGVRREELSAAFAGASVEEVSSDMSLVTMPFSEMVPMVTTLYGTLRPTIVHGGATPRRVVPRSLHVGRDVFFVGLVTPVVDGCGWLALQCQLGRVSSAFASMMQPLEVVHHGTVRGGLVLVVLMCRACPSQEGSAPAMRAPQFTAMLETLRGALAAPTCAVDAASYCAPFVESRLHTADGMSRRYSYCPESLALVTLLALRAHGLQDTSASILTSRAHATLSDAVGAFVSVGGGKASRIYSRPSRLRTPMTLVATAALPPDVQVSDLIRSIALLEGLEPPAAMSPLEDGLLRDDGGLVGAAAVPGDWAGVSIPADWLGGDEEDGHLFIFSNPLSSEADAKSADDALCLPFMTTNRDSSADREGALHSFAALLRDGGCARQLAFNRPQQQRLFLPLQCFIEGSSDAGYSLSSTWVHDAGSNTEDDGEAGDTTTRLMAPTTISSFGAFSPCYVPSGHSVPCVVITPHVPLGAHARESLLTAVALVVAGLAPAYRGFVVDTPGYAAALQGARGGSRRLVHGTAASASRRATAVGGPQHANGMVVGQQLVVLFESAVDACEFGRDALEGITGALYSPSLLSSRGSIIAPSYNAKGRLVHRGVPCTALVARCCALYDYQARRHVLDPRALAMTEACGQMHMPSHLVATHALVREAEDRLVKRFDVRQLSIERGHVVPQAFSGSHFMLLRRKGLPVDNSPTTLKWVGEAGKKGTAGHGSASRKSPASGDGATQFYKTVEHCAMMTFITSAPSCPAAIRGTLLQRLSQLAYEADAVTLFECHEAHGQTSGGSGGLEDTLSGGATIANRPHVLQLLVVTRSGADAGAIRRLLGDVAFGLAGCGASLCIISPQIPLATIEFSLKEQQHQQHHHVSPHVKVLCHEASMHAAAIYHIDKLRCVLPAAPCVVEVSFVPPPLPSGDEQQPVSGMEEEGGPSCWAACPLMGGGLRALDVPRAPSGAQRTAFVRASVGSNALVDSLAHLWSDVSLWGRAAFQRLRPYAMSMLPRPLLSASSAAVMPSPSAFARHVIFHVPRGSACFAALQVMLDTCDVTPILAVVSHCREDALLTGSARGTAQSVASAFESYWVEPLGSNSRIEDGWWVAALRAILEGVAPLPWVVVQCCSFTPAHLVTRRVVTAAAGSVPTVLLSHKAIASVGAVAALSASGALGGRTSPYLLSDRLIGALPIEQVIGDALSTAPVGGIGCPTLGPLAVIDARPLPHRDLGGDDSLWRIEGLMGGAEGSSPHHPTVTLRAKGPVPLPSPVSACYLSVSVQCTEQPRQSAVWTSCLAVLSSLAGGTVVTAERAASDIARWVVALSHPLRDDELSSLSEGLSDAGKSHSQGALTYAALLPASYWLAFDDGQDACFPELEPISAPVDSPSSAANPARGKAAAAMPRRPADANHNTTSLLGKTLDSAELWQTLRENPDAGSLVRVRPAANVDGPGGMGSGRGSPMSSRSSSPTRDRLAGTGATLQQRVPTGAAALPLEIGVVTSRRGPHDGLPAAWTEAAYAQHVKDAHAIAERFIAAYVAHSAAGGLSSTAPSGAARRGSDGLPDDDTLLAASGTSGAQLGEVAAPAPITTYSSSVVVTGRSVDGVGSDVSVQTGRVGRAHSWTQCGGANGGNGCGGEATLFGCRDAFTQWDDGASARAMALLPGGFGQGRWADDGGGVGLFTSPPRRGPEGDQFSLIQDAGLRGQAQDDEQAALLAVRRPNTAARVTVHVVTKDTLSSPGAGGRGKVGPSREVIGGTWHMSPVAPRLPSHEYAKGYVRVSHGGPSPRTPSASSRPPRPSSGAEGAAYRNAMSPRAPPDPD